MKKFSRLETYYWLALVVLVFACQREEGMIPLEEPPTAFRRVVTVQDIPEVTTTLLEKIGLERGTNRFEVNDNSVENTLEINWDKILQLVDSTGKATYTFGIADNDGDASTFYNLVLRYTVEGDARRPLLIKYDMDKDFLPEFLETRSMENFRGTVTKIFLDRVGSSNSTTNGARLDVDGIGFVEGDACPPDTPINGGGGSDTDAGGPSYECQSFLVTTTWYSQACSASGCDAPVIVGIETSIETECGWTNENTAADANSDCNPEEGEIPILPPVDMRCENDPLALMMITDYNLEKNSNRWGCVRLGATTCEGKKAHRGTDLAASIGTNVYAMADGTVFATGSETNADGSLKGWGHWIIIKTTIGRQTYLNLYAHLNSLPTVSGTITEGTLLGLSGDSGNAEGQPHLHMEFRKFTSGTSFNSSEDVDPELFFGATFDEYGNTNWDVTCD